MSTRVASTLMAGLLAAACSDVTGTVLSDAGDRLDAGSSALDASMDAGVDPCGDGVLQSPEACDDLNRHDGDGCSARCALEDGWHCEGEPAECGVTCGDGLVAGTEECDDTNTTAGDGCSLICRIEDGFSCGGTPSDCRETCGDLRVDSVEECDDGGREPSDGCSASCRIEPFFSCTGEPSTCTADLCGDGVVVAPEVCDDGGTAAFDGCTHCSLDPGWECVGGLERPSYCYALCGDGIVSGHEQCDDGNRDDGDDCNSFCLQPTPCMRCLQGQLAPPDAPWEFFEIQAAHPLSDCSVPFETTDPGLLNWTESGPAAGASWQQLCEDVVRCIIQTDCMRDNVGGGESRKGELATVELGRTCYCGPESTPPGWGFCTVEATGVCEREIEAAVGFTSSFDVAGALIATGRPGGAAMRAIRDSLNYTGSLFTGSPTESCAYYCAR